METGKQKILSLLEAVPDPEIPVLSVIDLGIVRDASASGSEATVVITPTYSGCPAMDNIREQIRQHLMQNGYSAVNIQTSLSPAWTTGWMTDAGREKLRAFGISPPNPVQSVCHMEPFAAEEAVQCPQCGSYHTKLISRFGSTACKALYKCLDCEEPFDYFKCH